MPDADKASRSINYGNHLTNDRSIALCKSCTTIYPFIGLNSTIIQGCRLVVLLDYKT